MQYELSEVTVRIHRSLVMWKMSARSLADLADIAGALELKEADRESLAPM